MNEIDMPRIAASSYSNTAPLVWSFLYGSQHGRVELILDNAPARSAELLSQDRVDAALVPVIASQFIDGVRLIPDVCVGAAKIVRSVCIATKGCELEDVRTVSLDVSSRTSVLLTKIIFREFLGFEPEWREARPNIDAMLTESDAALLIGDPALSIVVAGHSGKRSEREVTIRTFDLAELWHRYTGNGFVFAMWMTRRAKCPVDFAAARDEGLLHISEIASNYQPEIGLTRDDMIEYLTGNISYSIDESMRSGMELYFELAEKNGLIETNRRLEFVY